MTTATGFIVDRETEEMLEREERLVMEIRERIRAVEKASTVDLEEVQAIFSEIGKLENEYMLEVLWGLLNEVIAMKEVK